MSAHRSFPYVALFAMLLIIIGGGCAFIGSEPEGMIVEVPSGAPPRIDGVLSPGEWDGAMHVELDYARHLYFMQSDGYLFLGIDSGTMGYGSICIAEDDQVSLLHASAALGTAIFAREGDDWKRIRQFSYCCRETEPGSRQEQHLEEEGWLASIVYMGISDEMEYQIVMPSDGLVMGVVHQTGQTVTSALRWPETINDDCLGVVGILEDPPEWMEFSPETWPVFIAAGD